MILIQHRPVDMFRFRYFFDRHMEDVAGTGVLRDDVDDHALFFDILVSSLHVVCLQSVQYLIYPIFYCTFCRIIVFIVVLLVPFGGCLFLIILVIVVTILFTDCWIILAVSVPCSSPSPT